MRSWGMRWLVVLAPLVAACGAAPAPGTDAPPPTDGPPADAPDLTVIESRAVQIGPLTIAPGQEATVCVVADLGNDAPRMVRAVRSQLTAGTHHVIATLTTDPVDPTPRPCGAFAGGGPGAGILTIAQQPQAVLTYPAGAGLPIAAHQGVHLEMHYLNAGDQPLPIAGTITLDLAAAASLAPVELTFTGNSAISIAAHATAHLVSNHPLPAGATLFAVTAHTHQWGTRATLELLHGAGDPSPRLLHDSRDWADRPLDQLAPPVVIADGDLLRLTCDFDNRSDHVVSFGLSAEDEMCFLWAHHVTLP